MLSSRPPQTTEVVVLVKIEGTLEEIRAMFLEGAKEEAKKTAKAAGKKTVQKATSTAKKAVKRAPSAYNKYMKRELARLKKAHPRMTHQARFRKAAKSWKSKKGGKR